MTPRKSISLGDAILTGAICAGLVGLFEWATGPGRYPIFNAMWWCFCGSVNVYLINKPSTLDWVWSELRRKISQ
jgi:hypothetical protein